MHGAGLVHRDVKPDNVLRGHDGRVRLIDFGLVQGHQTGASAAGSFVGTPSYAAPEQRRGKALDARADQFSFCVAVWESLVGKRPSEEQLPAHRGQRVPLPPGQRMPGRVHRVLSRGLSRDAALRFETMETLLSALQPRRGRRWAATIGGAAGTAGLAIGLLSAPSKAVAELPCEHTARPLEARWSTPRRDALLASDPATAELVDGWAQRWRTAAQRACEEVHLEQLRPESSLGPRRACLDVRLDALDALLQAKPHGGTVPASWLEILDDPTPCLEPALLEAESDAPPDEQRLEVSRIRRALLTQRWGMDEPRLDLRRQQATTLYQQATALAYLPLVGYAALVRGHLARIDADRSAALQHFGQALDLGQHHDPLLAVDAWTGLHELSLDLETDTSRARWLADRRDHTLSQYPTAHARHAQAAYDRGRLLQQDGDLAGADSALVSAARRFAEAGPTAAWKHAAALRQLADIRTLRGRSAEAEPLLVEARQLERRHSADRPGPRGAAALVEAFQHQDAGELLQAQASFEEAITWLGREHGPGSLRVGNTHVALANLFSLTGDMATARVHARQADRLIVRARHPRHPDRVGSLSALGTIAFHEERFDTAADAFRLALAIAETHSPPGSVELAWARVNLAEALHHNGKNMRAESLLTLATTALRRSLGPDHPDLALPDKVLGAVAFAQGDLPRARASLEHARALAIQPPGSLVDAAEIETLLARVCWAQGDLAAARTHARSALDAMPPSEASSSRHAELRGWAEVTVP